MNARNEDAGNWRETAPKGEKKRTMKKGAFFVWGRRGGGYAHVEKKITFGGQGRGKKLEKQTKMRKKSQCQRAAGHDRAPGEKKKRNYARDEKKNWLS